MGSSVAPLKKREEGSERQRQTRNRSALLFPVLPWLSGSAVHQTEAAKKYRPALIWRLNYFSDNLYDFLWERRRTRRAAKASLRPWFGHSDIDLTVKTGAGELWCHDSMLSLLLSLKEDGSEGWAVEGETEGKSGGQWVKEWWRRFGIKQMN